jgi:malonyl-CoA O-methyltransferase
MSFVNSVTKRFSMAANKYHEHARLQRSIAEQLVKKFNPQRNFENILELGCGTGFLTALILEKYPFAHIDAVDISLDMIEEAKRYLNYNDRVSWYFEDARRYSKQSTYDFICSSSAIQWMTPLDQMFKHISILLDTTGELCFSIMLHQTLNELRLIRKSVTPHKLPSSSLLGLSEIEGLMHRAGLKVAFSEEHFFRQSYDNVKSFLNSIHMLGFTGGIYSQGINKHLVRGELNELMNLYEDNYRAVDGSVYATFHVGFITALNG